MGVHHDGIGQGFCNIRVERECCIFSCHMAGSVLCYTDLVARAGSVFAVGIATLRKSASLLLSFLDTEGGYEIAGKSTCRVLKAEAGHFCEVSNQKWCQRDRWCAQEYKSEMAFVGQDFGILVSELKSPFFLRMFFFRSPTCCG